MKILIGIDGSDESEKAVNYAFNLFQPGRDVLYFMSVFDKDAYDINFIEEPFAMAQVLIQEEGSAKEIIRGYERMGAARGFEVKGFFAKGGSAASVLIDQADKMDVDVLVVGARGMNAVKRLLLGSVSTYIVNHCARPVLVVKGSGEVHAPRRFMHCFDGSDSALRAFDICKQLMKKDSSVVCVAAYPPVKMNWALRIATVDDINLKETLAEVNAEGAEGASRALADFCRNAQAAGVAADPVLKVGDPASVLVEAAQENAADLVAVGSRGLGAFDRFRLGSVSNHVVHHADANAVLVVKEGAEREKRDVEVIPTGHPSAA